ncbi:MAG: competence/damage-inducible protein A [Methanobacteriota archaeon]|uniref:Competence/damage-inducible protein A n=1 Tax=Marine Group III euryarchaeote TaxID=2173149 RepID=A0A7J4GSL3_9ARCH|nr:MAG: competence/damage-inducible protein A [Euryarchaeota archaeon]HIF37606.1 competence/damage-inducible protein A [Marine Group III euryarchaeote]
MGKIVIRASLVIIGDEILSGRTEDTNLAYLAKWLGNLGIHLSEVRVVLDDEKDIIESVNTLRKKYDYVFTTGGIGPTHDDITTDSIAKAFGVETRIDDGALEKMKEFLDGKELTEPLLKMLHIPEGGELIYSPATKAPGYKIENVFVMAGIPKIMQGMLEGMYDYLEKGEVVHSRSFDILVGESFFAEKLEEIQQEFLNIAIGSYPFSRDGKYGATIVLRSIDDSALDGCEILIKELIAKY